MSWGVFLAVSFIWTGVLAGAAELLTRTNSAPHFARTVWRGAAALMVLPWLAAGAALLWPSAVADLPIPDFPDLAFAVESGGAAAEIAGGAAASPLPWGMIVLGVLGAGWLLRLVCSVKAQHRLQRLKAEAAPIDDRQLSALAGEYTETLGLKAVPRLSAIAGLSSPFAAGIDERTIYLPLHLIGSGHEPMIVAHESVHIARKDLVTRPFERLVADLIWYSPFAWLARRRLDYLREAVCDAETIALTGSRKAYARALVDVARASAAPEPLPVAAFILKDRGSLKRRVTSLLADRPASQKRKFAGALVAGVLAVPLALAQGLVVMNAGVANPYSHVVIAADSARISSPWGVCEECKPSKKKHFHKGVDISAPLGTPVYAPADAVVKHCGTKDGYGNVVDLLLSDGTKMRFAQLKKSKVSAGDTISAGDVVGLVGQSGTQAYGPHLHLEVWKKNADGEVVSHDPQAEGIQLIN